MKAIAWSLGAVCSIGVGITYAVQGENGLGGVWLMLGAFSNRSRGGGIG
jgi:hypothetical protein